MMWGSACLSHLDPDVVLTGWSEDLREAWKRARRTWCDTEAWMAASLALVDELARQRELGKVMTGALSRQSRELCYGPKVWIKLMPESSLSNARLVLQSCAFSLTQGAGLQTAASRVSLMSILLRGRTICETRAQKHTSTGPKGHEPRSASQFAWRHDGIV